MSLFIFGLGYSTTALARQAQRDSWHVTSTCRDPRRFAPLTAPHHQLVQFDPAAGKLLDTDALEALHKSQYVISSIPPVAARLYDPVIKAQHQVLRQVVSREHCHIKALAYLSSTGVYGDWQGDWVDESSEARTATARGILRLEAEEAWAQLAEQLQLPLTIFRLGGIYGPMRSVLHNLQQQQKAETPIRSSAVRRSQQRYTSRCHVSDVVAAVQADMRRRVSSSSRLQQQETAGLQQQLLQVQQERQPVKDQQGSLLQSSFVDVINVVDDEPAPRADVEAYALHLLGQDARSSKPLAQAADGPFSTMQQEPQQASGEIEKQQSGVIQAQQLQKRSERATREPLEEKRVRNDKLKTFLGVKLLAPTYREGLRLMHAGSIEPFAAEDLACLYGQKSCMAEPCVGASRRPLSDHS